MSTTRAPAHVHAAFVALCAVSLVVFFASGRLGRGLTLTTVSAGIAVSILIGLRRRRTATGPVWWLVFVAFCFLTSVNATWVVTVNIGGADAPPQPLTRITLAIGYLFLLGAALSAISPSARRDMGSVLDAATAGVGAAIALWLTVVDPALRDAHAIAPTRTFNLVVVVILSALAGALLRAAATSRAARPALAYFLTAVTIALAGNVLAAATANPRTGAPSVWASSLWLVSYIAAWAAAAHPASGAINDTVGRRVEGRLSTRRIALLGLALGIGPLLGVARTIAGAHVDWITLSISQLLMILMVLARVSQLAAAHRSSAAQLEYLADHDSLTGLANRRAVDRHLDALVTRISAGGSPGVVVLFVDLDDFKVVNDERGHVVGDELLAAVAGRLAGSVRRSAGDLVGRVGGDEFLIVVEGAPNAVGDSAITRARDAFAEPFLLASGPMRVSASIGHASASPDATASVDDLLTQADHAMYGRKRDGAAEAPRVGPGNT